MAVNRLGQEKSPYLQQHASNPVDWYPWGEEALQLAKKTNRPIFLSIGYSACHWCHVMAHESFENSRIATLMNAHFVNIKVDREERPDIDAIYMAAVQALTGSGGWPMSVWLTPDLKPFYGGTYFPPEDRHGRPGFPTVLEQLADVYKNEYERVALASDDLTQALKSQVSASFQPAKDLPEFKVVMEEAFQALKRGFDATDGGFGRAPKFPMPTYLDFLLLYYARTKNAIALHMVKFTLEKIIRGGIYDQLGGGFARYSTDGQWIVPHFEKMLYDNSQLISTCATLYQETKDKLMADTISESIQYILRDLTHPDGAFYSAEDADSEGKEGAFYVWTLAQIKTALPADLADDAIATYGVTPNGNFFDPHTQEPGQNILIRKNDGGPHQEIIKKYLFDVRSKRPRPFRDEKIITEWNGMMISTLVKAARVLKNKEWMDAAQRAARFVQKHIFDANTNRLYRRWKDGEPAVDGQQIDYAMFVRAMIDLYEATGQHDWLLWATLLQEKHDELFFDSQTGGYFMTEARADLLLRLKDEGDNVIPSGNSIAVWNGLKLTALGQKTDFATKATSTLMFFANRMSQDPSTLTSMMAGLDFRCGSLPI